jgi:mannose-6-phosphate isomerase-like protein (cupin superfamily)
MQVIDNTLRERATLPGIEHLTLAGGAQSLKRLSVWRQTMAQGSATPVHQHDCEEVVLVLEGSGEVRWDGGALAFGPDSTLVIPPRVAHEIVNTGAVPLVTVAAFSATPVGTFLPDGAPLELPWAS